MNNFNWYGKPDRTLYGFPDKNMTNVDCLHNRFTFELQVGFIIKEKSICGDPLKKKTLSFLSSRMLYKAGTFPQLVPGFVFSCPHSFALASDYFNSLSSGSRYTTFFDFPSIITPLREWNPSNKITLNDKIYAGSSFLQHKKIEEYQ